MGRAASGPKAPTKLAAVAISISTNACVRKCLTGLDVKSRAMDAAIKMVKITPTMEFSIPNTA